MISYKQWKLVNESFGSYTLGLKAPATVGGVVGSHLPSIDEAKKKMLGIGGEEKALAPLKKAKPADDVVDEKPLDEPEADEEDVAEKPEGDEDVVEPEADADADIEADADVVDDKPALDKKDDEKLILGKCKKKCKAKMTKEEKNWWDSIENMLDASNVNKKFGSGLTEDMLIALQNDPNGQLQQQVIEPGQPGFAPQTRIGEL